MSKSIEIFEITNLAIVKINLQIGKSRFAERNTKSATYSKESKLQLSGIVIFKITKPIEIF